MDKGVYCVTHFVASMIKFFSFFFFLTKILFFGEGGWVGSKSMMWKTQRINNWKLIKKRILCQVLILGQVSFSFMEQGERKSTCVRSRLLLLPQNTQWWGHSTTCLLFWQNGALFLHGCIFINLERCTEPTELSTPISYLGIGIEYVPGDLSFYKKYHEWFLPFVLNFHSCIYVLCIYPFIYWVVADTGDWTQGLCQESTVTIEPGSSSSLSFKLKQWLYVFHPY